MTDQRLSSRSSSAFAPSSRASDSSSVRPRNRRLLSSLEDDDNNQVDDDGDNIKTPTLSSGLFSAFSPSNSRTGSPLLTARSIITPNRAASPANVGAFLSDSWNQSWASVQGLASSFISGDDSQRNGTRSQSSTRAGPRPSSRAGLGAWGPAPPSKKPGIDDVAAGSLAEREAALKAARKASILESHAGVNGGLDITGKHKRRNSDETASEPAPPEEYLVYTHKVQPNDTYAGLILRYQCREDAFRKANGLWSRDSVQTRKWLTIPVDACEIRGRPCEPPSWHNTERVDHLAPTPAVEDESSGVDTTHDDFFSRPMNGKQSEAKPTVEEDKPWTHVRWVKIDTFQEPVEIARVSRKAMGYFPPRRRKSMRTTSSLSTPRQSFDLSSNPPGSPEDGSSRRHSMLSNRPQISTTTMSSPGRVRYDSNDNLPQWMRRPGGVGSMGRNVRAPGPDKDAFTSWTKKHLPGLNIEGLPSMSVMGTETAHFGFKSESSGLVENHLGQGQDTTASSRQGTGLDKAAAAVESWLRGALSRQPGTPLIGARGRPDRDGDLIELTDTGSDDGRPPLDLPTSMMDSMSLGTGSRSEGDSYFRGRTMATTTKGQKDD